MTGRPFVTCLWFDTQAEEAATFYAGIFKDAQLGTRAPLHVSPAPARKEK